MARQLWLWAALLALCKPQPEDVSGVGSVGPWDRRDGVEAVWLLFWQAVRGAATQASRGRRETRLAGASAPVVCSTSLRAPEDSVEQYAIAATRKNSRAPPLLRVLVSTTTNTYPNNQPGESKSSKPASVFKANTTNANFTNAVNAAHAPRTG